MSIHFVCSYGCGVISVATKGEFAMIAFREEHQRYKKKFTDT